MSNGEPSFDHWTDEQLIASLYGVGPDAVSAGAASREDAHLSTCDGCRDRMESLRVHRRTQEADAALGLDADFLIAQRRRIYAHIEKKSNGFLGFGVGRWASAAAALVTLLTGMAVLHERQTHSGLGQHTAAPQATISDAELSQEVSQMANRAEPDPAAPLRGLFQD